MNTTSVYFNGKSIAFRNVNVGISEIDEGVGLLIDVNGKHYGFAFRKGDIRTVLDELSEAGITLVDITPEAGALE